MTLILSFISKEVLIQVSDRSLFNLNTGKEESIETNKAVLYNQQICFGYTGISCIDNKPTDKWLADSLISKEIKPLPDILLQIADKATISFSKMNILNDKKRHAFVGIGWVQLTPVIPGEDLQPIYISISNARDESGTWTDQVNKNFLVLYRFISPDEKYIFETDGQYLPIEFRNKIRQRIEKAIKSYQNPSRAIEWIFVNAIQERSTKQSVGKNMTSVCIPRLSIEDGKVEYQRSKADKSSATFISWENGKPRQKFGPILINKDVFAELDQIGNITILRGEKARQKSQLLPVTEPPKVIVLTPWCGLGITSSPYQPLVQREYKFESCCDITSALGWSKTEKCPYYGLLVNIVIDSPLLQKLKSDQRFFVIYEEIDSSAEIPDEKWIHNLALWFSRNGMDCEKIEKFILHIHGATRLQIVEYLKEVLRCRKTEL